MSRIIISIFFSFAQRHFACVVILIFSSNLSTSQIANFNLVHYNINTEIGIPSLETYSVKQDSKGFIWICSDAGVTRYDGFELKTFTKVDGLTDNVVFDIYEDFKGRVWFLTYNSLLCYYEDEIIKPYKFNDKIRPIVKNKSIISRSFSMNKNGDIYYDLHNCGILKIDSNGNTSQLMHKSFDFLVDKINNELYITRNLKSVYSANDNNVLFGLKIKLNNKVKYIDSTIVSGHYFAPKGSDNLNSNYFLFDDEIYEFETGKSIYSDLGLLHFLIRDSVFWICTASGLKKGVLKDGKLKIIENFLPECAVSNLTFLKDGSMWVSTINAGVFVFNTYNLLQAEKKTGLVNPDIISIGRYKNDILVGSMNYLQNITSDGLFGFQPNYFGGVRFASVKNHLIISNTVFQNLKKIQSNTYGFPWTSTIFSNDSLIYMVCNSQIYVYNANNNSIRVLFDFNNKSNDLPRIYLHKITLNEKKELIVSSKTELFLLKNGKLSILNLPLDKQIEITSIKFHPRWGVIIGTSGDGLILFKNNQVRIITSQNGLLNDRINTVTVSDEGEIYIGSPNGMSIIRKDGRIAVFGKNQSLYNIDVNTIYIDNKDLYIGAKSGLFKLKISALDQCFEKIKPAKVKLKSVIFDDKNVYLTNKISFPYYATSLTLNFQVFEFSNWYSKAYEYKIGEQGNWMQTESPTINIYRPSGNFKIFVRYKDSKNSWSKTTLLCSVDVILPFWKKWYFWAIISFFFVLILFLLFRKAQKRIHDKLIYDNQMLSLEQQMQNARMNPHFIFNVLNSIHSYVLTEDIEKADSYLMKFSKLMREILMSSKEGIITLKQECSILNKYLELEQLRHHNAFVYEIDITMIQNINHSIPSMMIQPFIENAVLYSQKGTNEEPSKIKIDFVKQNADFLHVIISNTGAPSEENRMKMNLSNTKNAIGITRSRLYNYNKLLHTDVFGVDVQIINNTLTSINLIVPIMLKSELNDNSN